MRMKGLRFEPPKIQISQEEILADLRYPASRKLNEPTAVLARTHRRRRR
ncbi:MAG: hypothetical protein M3O25_12380 [Actinomycetota bacterium]|nr:hypothetical protein [Actinomycetota bacterium]